ncbi:MAG: DUF2934 domain-containing protein [Acetobacteraceae bacterium]
METDEERAIRERAYFLWEEEGRPEGRALDHWQQASGEMQFLDEEKVMDGRADANIPAMLTKEVPGG